MFTAIVTVQYNDGTSAMYGDGYAASGADELDTFIAELVKRAHDTPAGTYITGLMVSVVIS